MEDLPLGRISALVPEFAVKDLPLGKTHDNDDDDDNDGDYSLYTIFFTMNFNV